MGPRSSCSTRSWTASRKPDRRVRPRERREESGVRLADLNGPNLNLLREREPEIYGSTTLAEVEAECRAFPDRIGASLSFHQSNHEGVLVDLIQDARMSADALIINPAGYSFTSISILDAMKVFKGPI